MRRVATLVARGEPPQAVFTAVLEEVGRLLPVDLANVCRYEPDRTETFVATWGAAGAATTGSAEPTPPRGPV